MSNELLEKTPPGTERPMWSVMIPVYNAGDFLAKTIESVIQQAPAPAQMEIFVVDDHSTDDPKTIVDRYGGRVQYFRQPENVGHTANFKTCLHLSSGTYIHLLHGDDLVYPGYYHSFEKLFGEHPELAAAFCRCNFINENDDTTNTSASYQSFTGPFPEFFPRICLGQMIQTPSIVVNRWVYESIGIFNSKLSWSEDWEMWARIGSHYPVGFINEVLAGYRIHSRSNSGKYVLSGENIKDLRRAIGIITGYIKEDIERVRIKRICTAYYARYASEMATELMAAGKPAGARNQLKHALLMCDSVRVNLRLIKSYVSTFFK